MKNKEKSNERYENLRRKLKRSLKGIKLIESCLDQSNSLNDKHERHISNTLDIINKLETNFLNNFTSIDVSINSRLNQISENMDIRISEINHKIKSLYNL